MTRTPTATFDPWSEVSAARIPAKDLKVLAPLRNRGDVRVRAESKYVWVRWQRGIFEVVHCLLPVPGVEFFTLRDGRWFRFASRLPASVSPPEGEGAAIATLLSPEPFQTAESGGEAAFPLTIRAVRGGPPRPASALSCRTADLATWVETATTLELGSVRGTRSGDLVFLFGSALPAIPHATRYWGDDLLVPLGFLPEPLLPASTLRAALEAAPDELIVLGEFEVERIPLSAIAPLNRASLRMTLRRSAT